MKFVSLFILSILISCGSPKTTTTLNVVKGFSAINVQEHGGIIIQGENLTSGASFTVALPTGSSRSLELANGSWKFSAFSWDGGPSTPKIAFSGVARCAQAETQLDGANVEVNLNLTQSQCSLMQTAYELRDFQLKTCGAFYMAPAMTTPVINDSSSDTDKNALCAGTYPAEYKTQLQSYRITALNIINSSISEGYSYCADFPSAPDAALPFKHVPLKIELFKDNNCRNLFNDFTLSRGLNFQYQNLDQLISNTHLILPSTRSRKGYSPFMDILPRMECGLADGNCLGPITSTPATRRIPSGAVGTEIRLFDKRGVDLDPCPLSSQGSFDLDCDYNVQEKRLSIKASLNNADPCAAALFCTEVISLNIDGNSQTIPIIIEDSQADRNSARVIASVVWGISGVHAINPSFLPYFQDKDSNNSDDDFTFRTRYGVLGSVRSMLGPDAVGGALSNYTCSDLTSQVVTSEQIPVHEDNQVRYYRVRSIPGDASFPSDMGGGTTNLNLQLQLLESGTWETEQSYRLSCSSKLGYSYFRRVESDRSEYQKIYWNLVTAGSEKLEHYYLEQETYSTRESMGAQRMHKNGSTDYSIRLVSIDAPSTLEAKNSTVLELVHSGGSTLSFKTDNQNIPYMDDLSTAKDLSGAPDYTFPRTNIESYDFTGFGVVATSVPVSIPVWAPNSSILGPATPLSPFNLDPTRATFKDFMQTVTP